MTVHKSNLNLFQVPPTSPEYSHHDVGYHWHVKDETVERGDPMPYLHKHCPCEPRCTLCPWSFRMKIAKEKRR